MYRNLEAEIARAGITQSRLAEELGITPTTLSLKLNGKSNLSLQECVKIKRFLGANETIDYLFATEDEKGA
ncbi:MAG: helix-turn-helix transcriptional regulator [Clostridium sp.]|mgnify:CR=1 FL=1